MADDDARTAAVSAYTARAADYAAALGSVEAASERDRALIGRWADGLEGPLLDLGCGPGHWTAWLASRGLDAEGIDPVSEFIDHARHSFPSVPFRVGSAETLDVEDAYGGVLVWFSLIHHDPEDAEQALARVVSSLRPGGSALVGFFEADAVVPLEHAVAPAFSWSRSWVEEAAAKAGATAMFEESVDLPRLGGTGTRRNGAVTLRRHSTDRRDII